MEALNNLLIKSGSVPAQTIVSPAVNKQTPLNVRSDNGRFTKKTVVMEEDIDDAERAEISDTRILNPKISKLPKRTIIRPKKKNYEEYEMTGLGFPTDLKERAELEGRTFTGPMRYSIPVYCRSKDNPLKKHVKNVHFGNVNEEDFLHTGDNMKRLKYVNKKPLYNFLDARFYKTYLLNSESRDIIDATRELKKVLKM